MLSLRKAFNLSTDFAKLSEVVLSLTHDTV